MSQLYWDNTSFLSPLFTMDHKQLKRSRSSDSINDNKILKRSKPFQLIESPTSVSSEPVLHTTALTPTSNIYPNSISPLPTHVYQQQPQQQQPTMKSISISLKTDNSIQEQQQLFNNNTMTDYENINGILYNAHVERYGDPERRESWWQEQQDIDMDEDINDINNNSGSEYNAMNSVLRQAFLQRHGHR